MLFELDFRNDGFFSNLHSPKNSTSDLQSLSMPIMLVELQGSVSTQASFFEELPSEQAQKL